MKLIDDAKSAWRFFSVQAMVLASSLLAAWELLPPDLKAGLTEGQVRWTAISVLALGVVGRMVDQTKK